MTNSFGGYKYRSCEKILEALKPICAELDCAILLKDEMTECAGSAYVKATAYLVDVTGEIIEQATAYAREEFGKKGMDASQMTGCSSSYARKYALNGLLAIDDTKDADTDEYRKQTQNAANTQRVTEKKPLTEREKEELDDIYAQADFAQSKETLKQLYKRVECSNIAPYVADKCREIKAQKGWA